MNETTPSTTLPVAAPPMMEAAIGYFGEARLVAFYFGAGDEAYFADGRVSACGEWDAYDLYTNHPLIAPHLRGYDFGSSEEPPVHYLLLDRQARTLSVAPVALAQRLLREQWGEAAQPEPVLVVTELEWDQLIGDLIARMSESSSAQMAEYWRDHCRLVEQLSAWLAEKWEGA